MATGRIAPSLLLLLLAGNAWASGIMASVSFDENGKSVPLSKYDGPVTLSAQWDGEKGEAAGTLPDNLAIKMSTGPYVPKKEPAVEWFGGDMPKFHRRPDGFIAFEDGLGCDIEIGLRQDGVVVWRRKAK